jgi:hypothetical protein
MCRVKKKTISFLFTELYSSDSTGALRAIGVDISHHRWLAGVIPVVDRHKITYLGHRDVRICSRIAGSLDRASHVKGHIVQFPGGRCSKQIPTHYVSSISDTYK